MIKKAMKNLLGLFILGIGLINITYGENEGHMPYTRDFYNVNTNFHTTNIPSIAQKVLTNSNFSTLGKNIFAVQENFPYENPTKQLRYIYRRGTSGDLYAYGNQEGTIENPQQQEYLKFLYVYKYPGTTFTNVGYWYLGNPNSVVPYERITMEQYKELPLDGKVKQIAILKTQATNSTIDSRTAFCFIYDNVDYSICIKPAGAITTVDIPYVSGLTINPEDFPTEIIGNSPRAEKPNTSNIRTGKNYYCPTFGQLIEMQPSNYNTGLCYNGTLKYENGQITTVQKQDIQTVFTNYQEYQQYLYLYNNYCTGPATQTACENAFSGNREKYSIIANATKNNVDNKQLWNYCNIYLNYDLNTTTCVASQSGYIAEQPTQQELIEYIENIANIGDITTPTEGNILNNLIGSGDTREDIASRDLFGQLNQIKEKVSSIFNERNGVNGIIPDYILWLILTTLLLTVLFKK